MTQKSCQDNEIGWGQFMLRNHSHCHQMKIEKYIWSNFVSNLKFCS